MAPHILLFPFMSKGHTIPLLHLAQLLLNRGVAVTIVTTSGNQPFISRSLSRSPHLSIALLPFPKGISSIPEDADSTDKLPSMSLFIPFVNSLELMQPSFEDLLRNIHSEITCIVSDGFLAWTLPSASRFGIPRLSYLGVSYYASVVSREVSVSGLLSLHESGDEPFTLAKFPWITLTRNDFDHPFCKRDPMGPHLDFIKESIAATESSYGLLMNSFEELESPYIKYFEKERIPKVWSLGPLCLTKLHNNDNDNKNRPEWMHWLDQRSSQRSPVLYIAFGSQAKHSQTQFLEIARALEGARVSFLWVVKQSEAELLSKGYEERVGERGCIVTKWVDQEEILRHPIVLGFLSHCGWNSVLDAICGEVPILAWPMMADQHMNAKLVAEEIKMGIQVATVDGSARGFVRADSLRNAMAELIEGAEGKEMKAKVKEVAEAARRAVAEGGSSWLALEGFIDEMKLCREKSLAAAQTSSFK